MELANMEKLCGLLNERKFPTVNLDNICYVSYQENIIDTFIQQYKCDNFTFFIRLILSFSEHHIQKGQIEE